MSGQNNQQFETKRLLLRRLAERDLNVYAEIMGLEEVGKQLPIGRGFTFEESEKLLRKFNKLWEENGYGVWAVIEKESGELMGHCGLNFVKELDEVEVLYAFSSKCWGQGYATEAAYASIQYGFNVLKLERIIGLTKLDNLASARVLEKVGLIYQGNKEVFKMNCRYFLLNQTDFRNNVVNVVVH